jgi:hypothetical protein
MGYGNTTYIIHGLYLDAEQSKQLREGIRAWLKTDDGLVINAQIEEEDDLYTLVEMLSDEDEETGIRVCMVSEDTHATIHSGIYEEGRFHGFGILMGDKGYASCRPADDFAKFTKSGPTDEQRNAYRERLGGILKCAGFDALEPETVVVSHIS